MDAGAGSLGEGASWEDPFLGHIGATQLDFVQACFEIGRFEEAGRRLERLLRDAPARPELLYWKGVLHVAGGDASQAVALLEGVELRVRQQLPEVYMYLGLAYVQLGDVDKLCAAFRKYLRLAERQEYKGLWRHKVKSTAKIDGLVRWLWPFVILAGLLAWTLALPDSSLLAQDDPRGSRGSSIVWVDGGEEEEPWIGRVERDAVTRPDYRYWKGLIQVLEGDPARGSQLMESVLPDLESDLPEIHFYLGVAYAKLRRNEAMCGAFRKYLMLTQSRKDWTRGPDHVDLVEQRIEDRCL